MGAVFLCIVHGLFVATFNPDQGEVGVQIGLLAGQADVVADVADVGGGQHHVPVPMAVAGPAVEPVHGPVSGLGGKMGLDATNKWPGETQREWGRPMHMTPEASARAEALMRGLGL